MAKPDPSMLEPARYPFHCAIEPRFTDLDLNMHVNNAALADILQEGRIRFHHACDFGQAIQGITALAVSLSIEFLGEALHPDPLDNHLAAIAVGRTSHTLGHLVTQNGKMVAYAQAVLVCVKNGQPTENPPSFLESVSKWRLKP